MPCRRTKGQEDQGLEEPASPEAALQDQGLQVQGPEELFLNELHKLWHAAGEAAACPE